MDGCEPMFSGAKAIAVAVVVALVAPRLAAQQERQLDPAAWGGDHVGKPVPSFTSGDECLFCHRLDVGPTWSANRHGRTIRPAEAEAPGLSAMARAPELKSLTAEVEFLIGGENRLRFLKRGAEQGKVDLLTVAWTPPRLGAEGKLTETESPHWDSKAFGSRCAGCHSTGVDSMRQSFSALSLDCFACHGEIPDKHTTEPSLAILSPQRRDSAAAITSICGQCHLRTGTSRSTDLPFPNTFVAGDNLFRDFRVDLSEAALAKLNPADRHVQENVRDVVLLGREGVTCLSCHDVHKQSSKKHHTVAAGNICRNCHTAGSKKERVAYEVHSATCGY